jgi:CHASE2 domain-containing sensor protein
MRNPKRLLLTTIKKTTFCIKPQMNRHTLSIVILGLALTVSVGLFVGGCKLLNNWWSMFALIPALLALVTVYGIHSTSGYGAHTG